MIAFVLARRPATFRRRWHTLPAFWLAKLAWSWVRERLSADPRVAGALTGPRVSERKWS